MRFWFLVSGFWLVVSCFGLLDSRFGHGLMEGRL